MNPDRIVRPALWATAFMNVIIALALAAPDSALGRAVGLPADVPALYRLLVGWCVALFGLMYGWLASQGQIPRPGVLFGAIGKAGVFAIAFVLWIGGALGGDLTFLASGDLGFAGLFFWWLRATAN